MLFSKKQNTQEAELVDDDVSAFRSLVVNDLLEYWHQPIVDIHSQECVGFELLLRTKSKNGSGFAPTKLLSMGKKAGACQHLFDLALKNAFSHRHGIDNAAGIKAYVNIVEAVFHDKDLTERCEQIAATHDSDLSDVVIEANYHFLRKSLDVNWSQFIELSDKDISLAVDGCDDPEGLEEIMSFFRFEEVKIAYSLVSNASSDVEAAEKIAAICNIVHRYGSKVTAVGVESIADWTAVKSLGVDFVQGFLIEKALPADSVNRWLENWRRNKFSALTK